MSADSEHPPDDICSRMARVSAEVDAVLENILPAPDGPEGRLYEAMRYAALAPGKRFRSNLVLAGADIFDVPRHSSLLAAAAVELVHTYSLVHDDLPCMDDGETRRGQPATHVRFDEPTAVLAGDALLPLAFQVLARKETYGDPGVRLELVTALAQAAGAHGMAGGQMIDLIAEKSPRTDVATITRLQQLKTGALITFSCEAGAILGHATPNIRHVLRAFAHDLGLAFQMTDDLLDVEGSQKRLGKGVQRDSRAGKATFIAALGPDRARSQAGMLAEQAVEHLDAFGAKADFLRQLARFAVRRDA